MFDPEFNFDVYDDFEAPDVSEVIHQLDCLATELLGCPSESRPNIRHEELLSDGRFFQVLRKLDVSGNGISSYTVTFSTLFDVEIDFVHLMDDNADEDEQAIREITGKGLFLSAHIPSKSIARFFAPATVEVDSDGDISFNTLIDSSGISPVSTLLPTDLLVIGEARRTASY